MEQNLTLDDLQEFERITQFPLTDYLQSFNLFIKFDIRNIISFYSGSLQFMNKDSYNKFLQLSDQTHDLFSIISLNKYSFRNYRWWILINNLEQIDNLLLKLNTASKWLRSSISKVSFNANPEISVVFKQGQTLENVQKDILGSSDWDNTWQDLAIKNDLREEDYTSNAGFLLRANFNFTLNNFKINSIIDNPIDERILGIDLASKLEFGDDQDLKSLTPQNTFLQNANILLKLRKGDNPEFPDDGITPSLIIGSNINSLSYPALFRQLLILFKGDDTIKTFTLIDIKRDQDGVFLNFQIESRLGDLNQISLII